MSLVCKSGYMSRIKKSYLLAIILGVLSIGIFSGCRSTAPSAGPTGDLESALTASAAADIVIVEKGSPRLTRVQPVPALVVLSPGETIGFSALAFDQEGREIEQVSMNWQLVDQEAGTVTPKGVFRAGFTTGTFDDVLVVTARAPGLGPGLVQAAASVTVGEFKRKLEPVSIRVFPEEA